MTRPPGSGDTGAGNGVKIVAAIANEAPADAVERLLASLRGGGAAGVAVCAADVTRRPPAFRALVEAWGERAREALAAQRDAARAGWLRAWSVDEAQPLALPRSPRPGEAAPGVRLITLCRRRRGLTRAQFAEAWRGEHWRIALSFTIPPRGYAQDVVTGSLWPPDDVDGIACLHFASYAEFDARFDDHPEEAARGLADAERFLDLERSETSFAIETLHEPCAAAAPRAAPGEGHRHRPLADGRRR